MSTWWIHEPFIRGSSNPTNEELETLRAQGFNVLVCLLDENEPPAYDLNRARTLGYIRYPIPIPDFHAPTIAQLRGFTNLVKSLCPDQKMLVHCQGGTGRTGTMAAAYWIAKGLAADAAIERIRLARPAAVDTEEQKAALREFASQLEEEPE